MRFTATLYLSIALFLTGIMQGQYLSHPESQKTHNPFWYRDRSKYPAVLADSLATDSFHKRRTDLPSINSNLPLDSWNRKQPPFPKPYPDEQAFNKRAIHPPAEFSSYPLPINSTIGAVDTAWVRHYASGLVPSYDAATSIALDAVGNVYVTGSSKASRHGSDFLTIKYNTVGSKIWEARFNGPGNSEDNPFAVKIDTFGNVYVTGRSGYRYNEDFATIKYDSAGTEQWASYYDGLAHCEDGAVALDVDDAGNVYVTGWSCGYEGRYDYVTVKYNSSGEEQWATRYNGLTDGEDVPSSIAVDNFGNVYVTGESWNGNSFDYATLKYDLEGVKQWIAFYDGPASSGDVANALEIDNSGNVYVTGWSYGSTDADYASVKYDPNGIEQWAARYNGPTNGIDQAISIAVDTSGNVYVTGISSIYNYGDTD